MKNIVIIGPPRTGKTTLSKLIVKEVPIYSVINTDVIREGIYEAFFKDVIKKERKLAVKSVFPAFIDKILEHYQKYYNPDLYYIIEGDMLTIEDAVLLKDKYNIEIICVGKPNTSKEELFKLMRENSSKYGCWTEKYTDVELLDKCQKIIEQSIREEKIAKEKDIIYLDTSINNNCLLEYLNNIDMI